MRLTAVQALGALKERAKEHAGAIAARLKDENSYVRRAAVRALGALGEHGASTI